MEGPCPPVRKVEGPLAPCPPGSAVYDHYIICCTRKNIRTKSNSHKGIQSRSLKNYSKEDFVEMLKNVNWSTVYRSCNADELDL